MTIINPEAPGVLIEQTVSNSPPVPTCVPGYSPEFIPKEKGGARIKFAKLAHDPLTKLVQLNGRLEEELHYSNRRRSGEVVELNSKGGVREFYHDNHLAIYDKLIKVNETLMKYAYVVPKETLDEGPKLIPEFTVILE